MNIPKLQLHWLVWKYNFVSAFTSVKELFERQTTPTLLVGVFWFTGMAIALPYLFQLMLWITPVLQVLLGLWAIVHVIALMGKPWGKQ